MIESSGVLRYSLPHKLVVDVDPGLVDVYRALVPAYLRLRRQKWPAHITVVREESIAVPSAWGRHEGETVVFEFHPFVMYDTTYFWLDVTCHRLCDLRIELGLPAMSNLTRPPDGKDFFHITLGNAKAP